MPGILPMKVIKVGANAPARIAQACDRCRSKKIRCDGFRPCCSQCANVGFECKTSDKLSRRAFPRGYTESLEERVRILETEVRELKDLLDAKDEKIDMLSRIHQSPYSRRPSSSHSPSDSNELRASIRPEPASTFTMHQTSTLQSAPGSEPYFIGSSSSRSVADALRRKAQESGRSCPSFDSETIFPTSVLPKPRRPSSNEAWAPLPRLLTDQMVNIFFQEWAPLFPVLHRPTFLSLYETYTSGPERVPGQAAQVQLNLVFGIAARSHKTRVNYDTTIVETHWLHVLDAFSKQSTLATLQCLILAQIFCIQTNDYGRLNHYRTLCASVAQRLGLHQSQKRFSLSILACETRKKVFWTMYTLDCFSATVLGLPLSMSDSDVHCEYPIDIDDEYISEQGIQPALPGESTKLSSALALFKVVRILARVLRELYPASFAHEISLSEVSAFSDELDAWLAGLPQHLRMEFANDKPAATTISSRAPFLSLAYFFVRSLIHRPVACCAETDQASASTMVLASASKSIIQVCQLLDERSLSFSFCLNRNELMALCGCSMLQQTIDLKKDSVLLKDYQRFICMVIEMMRRQDASGEAEFRRLACSLISVRRESMPSQPPKSALSPVQSPQDSISSPLDLDTALSKVISTDSMAGESSNGSTPDLASRSGCPASQSAPKPFRRIAPSTQRRVSRDISTKSSPKTPSLSELSSVNSSRSQASVSNPSLNLDYFIFPDNAVSERKSKRSASQKENSPGLDALFGTLGCERGTGGVDDGPFDESEWPSFNDLLSPLQGPATAPSTSSGDHWSLEAAAAAAPEPAKATPAAKPQSVLSFSGESMTSAEDLGGYDWVSAERDGAFAAAMAMPDLDEEPAAA